jgi:hypothetical protein
MDEKIDFTQPGAPLIHPNAADQALRDLMPVVEALTNYGLAKHDGAYEIAARSLEAAVELFNRVPARSPSITAYMNWLVQNTKAEEAARKAQ